MNNNEKNLIPSALQSGEFNNQILVNGIEITWNTAKGQCSFRDLPVAMMWVDTTLAGLMSGVAAMVGPERFILALQAEGRKSVESDWILIEQFPDFRDGFQAINLNAAVAGWGDWQLIECDMAQQRCVFRAYNNWEGLYQRALGVSWGSGLLAGKFSGICSKLFKTNCWATQTHFSAQGAEYDEFIVEPSSRNLEEEIEKLLLTDQATRADMAVALQKLRAREQQLQQANNDLQRFAEVSAHHLMEPTRRLNSYSQRLASQLARLSIEDEQLESIQQNLDYIQRDAKRLNSRLHDIQLYLTATDPLANMEVSDANAIVHKIRQEWTARLQENQAELIIDNLPSAYLDKPRLSNLFMLLIDNVLKHAKPLATDNILQIHIGGVRLGTVSRYYVSDNGVGILRQYHQRVFVIFERLTHHHETGTGIGLAIARRIVESRHGRIWLENNDPCGLRVVFELPD